MLHPGEGSWDGSCLLPETQPPARAPTRTRGWARAVASTAMPRDAAPRAPRGQIIGRRSGHAARPRQRVTASSARCLAVPGAGRALAPRSAARCGRCKRRGAGMRRGRMLPAQPRLLTNAQRRHGPTSPPGGEPHVGFIDFSSPDLFPEQAGWTRCKNRERAAVRSFPTDWLPNPKYIPAPRATRGFCSPVPPASGAAAARASLGAAGTGTEPARTFPSLPSEETDTWASPLCRAAFSSRNHSLSICV